MIEEMPRKFDDLSEQEWEEAEQSVRAANGSIDDNTLLVRSHVWPDDAGTFDWLIFVPDTPHRARGNAPSLPEAYEAMNACVRSWYPELTEPDGADSWMTMVRMRPD